MAFGRVESSKSTYPPPLSNINALSKADLPQSMASPGYSGSTPEEDKAKKQRLIGERHPSPYPTQEQWEKIKKIASEVFQPLPGTFSNSPVQAAMEQSRKKAKEPMPPGSFPPAPDYGGEVPHNAASLLSLGQGPLSYKGAMELVRKGEAAYYLNGKGEQVFEKAEASTVPLKTAEKRQLQEEIKSLEKELKYEQDTGEAYKDAGLAELYEDFRKEAENTATEVERRKKELLKAIEELIELPALSSDPSGSLSIAPAKSVGKTYINDPMNWETGLYDNIKIRVDQISPSLSDEIRVPLIDAMILEEAQKLQQRYRTAYHASNNILSSIFSPGLHKTLKPLFSEYPTTETAINPYFKAAADGFSAGFHTGLWSEAVKGISTKGAGTVLKPQNLMDELAKSGVKYNPDDVVTVIKTQEDKLMWLEKGNSSSGLNHIVDGHAPHFSARGIGDIPEFLNRVLQETPAKVAVNKAGPYAEYLIDGSRYRVVYGTNGYVVSFFPID